MNSDVLKLFRYRDACYIMKSRRDPVTWILHQYMLYKLISAWRDDENLFESVKDYASFTDNDMIKTLFAGLVIGSLFRSGRPLVNDKLMKHILIIVLVVILLMINVLVMI